jgi:hypothetical protein
VLLSRRYIAGVFIDHIPDFGINSEPRRDFINWCVGVLNDN